MVPAAWWMAIGQPLLWLSSEVGSAASCCCRSGWAFASYNFSGQTFNVNNALQCWSVGLLIVVIAFLSAHCLGCPWPCHLFYTFSTVNWKHNSFLRPTDHCWPAPHKGWSLGDALTHLAVVELLNVLPATNWSRLLFGNQLWLEGKSIITLFTSSHNGTLWRDRPRPNYCQHGIRYAYGRNAMLAWSLNKWKGHNITRNQWKSINRNSTQICGCQSK